MTDDEKRRLANRVETIMSNRRKVNELLGAIESELSRLPNPVAVALAPDYMQADVWHTKLTMLNKMVANGKQSWIHTDHDLAETLNQLSTGLKLYDI